MLSMDNEIITCNSTKSDDVKDIEKAIEKLQEKRLVDLYLSSNLDVENMIHRLISMIEIKCDKNYNIEIKDIKFTDEFITKKRN